MNTVSGSNSFSTSSAASRGIGGLVSGLDTESMVESMLSGTQNKIDKATGEKQIIAWKQEMYRDIISKINTFQSSFFGKTSKTNLTSADFFNSMSAACGSSAIKVSASSSAAAGRTEIKVGQLATASKLQSAESVSGTLGSTINLDAIKRTLVFEVEGREKTIDLAGATTVEQMAQKLTDGGVQATVNDKGSLVIEGKDIRVSSKSSKLGLEMLGLPAGSKTEGSPENGFKLATNAKPDVQASFDLVLNGVKYNINLKGIDDVVNDPAVQNDPTRQMAALESFLQGRIDDKVGGPNSAGIRPVTIKLQGDGSMTITTAGKGQEVYITGNQHGLKFLGVKDGQSNKLNKGQSLQNINFRTSLQGSSFKFSINGEQFEFTGDTKLSEMMNKINSNSNAGVRITYSELEDKFTIESSSTGAGRNIRLEQTEGNLLNAMFGNIDGVTTGGSASSKALVTNSVKGGSDVWDAVKSVGNYPGGSFKLTMNGTMYAITIPPKSGNSNYSRAELKDLINEGLADRFGYEGSEQAIELVGNDADGYSLAVRNGYRVKIADDTGIYTDGELDPDKAKDLTRSNLALAFGLNNADNNAKSEDEKLTSVGFAEGTLTIGTTNFTIGANTKISDLLDAIETGLGVTAEFKDGKLVVNGSGTFALPPELGKLFGTNSLTLNGQQAGSVESKLQAGQDAVVTINGVDTERSSNTFTVNGLTITLNDTTGSYVQLGNRFDEGSESGWKDGDGNQYYLDADQKITKIKLTDGSVIDASTPETSDNKALKSIIGAQVDDAGYLLGNDGLRAFAGDTAKIDTTRDTESIVKGLKSFVEEYNKLIDELNGKVDEKATNRDYPPLTAAQKKEMSEREIELWEEKAKGGLLRSDSDISTFLQSMRSVLYSRPEGSQYALYDIGIETSSDWKEKGKLTLDESALLSMLESNPQAVQELFATAQTGLAAGLNDVINRTANTNSASAGTLVKLAGVEGKASELTNDLTKRTTSLNSRIKDLQKRYEKEKARYWNQFNRMENLLSQMNSQSSWLAQQFST